MHHALAVEARAQRPMNALKVFRTNWCCEGSVLLLPDASDWDPRRVNRTGRCLATRTHMSEVAGLFVFPAVSRGRWVRSRAIGSIVC